MPNRFLTGQTTYGTALQFASASSQYAKTAANPSVATNNYTVAAWVKPTALGTAICFFANGHGGGSGTGYSLVMNSSNVLGADYAYVVSMTSAVTATVNTWYHLAVVRNAGTSQVYVNGAASGSTSGSAPFALDRWASIGAMSDENGNPIIFSNCVVDDIRLYDRALSAGEMAALYNYGLDINSPDISNTSLKLWWKLEEGSGTSLTDSSGNSQTGTTSGTPTWVTGKVQVSNVPARTAVTSPARSVAGTRTLVQ